MGELTKNLRTVVVPDKGKYSFLTAWEYDSWNRLISMHYPDGEELNYSYNSGGQMIYMSGKKGSNSYEYVNFIAYDKFGNRKYIAYGNGTQTTYSYDAQNLRMKNLQTTTAAGRLIQNNSYIYDAVGNILNLTNNADPVTEDHLYGGASTNSYTYDNRYQLITAEGSFTGNDKEHKYSMAMEYGATGNILRKTQSNQWRKNEGEWLTDAGTSMDYRYSYKGQKPHAVSSIIDNNTETLFTYTYDASGNNLLETNSKASSDREIVWTEDNRLAAIKARGNVSHYVYDANGIRTLKMSSSGFNISINGVAAGTNGIDGNFTIYANPYTVVRENQCTKHFFLGSQRILTKISSSDVSHTFYEGHAQNQVGGVDYESMQAALDGNITINNKQLNVGWYRETRGRVPSPYIKHYLRSKEHGGLSGNNPWGEGNNTNDTDKTATYEEKQYYFHPDHLGSTNYLTDVLGEAYQHVAYLPWGEVFVEQRNTQTSRNTFLYTGKELDEETGLYYYEQRYYDPLKSYFLGVDQLADKYPNISSYAYCANNPVLFIDPNGQEIWIHYNDADGNQQKLQYTQGMKYKGDAFVSATITALNQMNSTEIGGQVLGELVSSENLFNFTNTFARDEEGNEVKNALSFAKSENGGGEIYAGALMGNKMQEGQNLESTAHELFHGYQYEKGQILNGSLATVNNEIGAYLFGRAVYYSYYQDKGFGEMPWGNGTQAGDSYHNAMSSLIWAPSFNYSQYSTAVNNFKAGSSVNVSKAGVPGQGSYKNFKVNTTLTDPLIKNFFPLVR